jgi:hypothetical protein
MVAAALLKRFNVNSAAHFGRLSLAISSSTASIRCNRLLPCVSVSQRHFAGAQKHRVGVPGVRLYTVRCAASVEMAEGKTVAVTGEISAVELINVSCILHASPAKVHVQDQFKFE